VFRALAAAGAPHALFADYARGVEPYLRDNGAFAQVQMAVFATLCTAVWAASGAWLLAGARASADAARHATGAHRRFVLFMCLAAGAALQGSFAHAGASVYDCSEAACGPRDPAWRAPPSAALVLAINAAVALVPAVTAAREAILH
jgi:hypothetical protein